MTTLQLTLIPVELKEDYPEFHTTKPVIAGYGFKDAETDSVKVFEYEIVKAYQLINKDKTLKERYLASCVLELVAYAWLPETI